MPRKQQLVYGCVAWVSEAGRLPFDQTREVLTVFIQHSDEFAGLDLREVMLSVATHV